MLWKRVVEGGMSGMAAARAASASVPRMAMRKDAEAARESVRVCGRRVLERSARAAQSAGGSAAREARGEGMKKGARLAGMAMSTAMEWRLWRWARESSARASCAEASGESGSWRGSWPHSGQGPWAGRM